MDLLLVVGGILVDLRGLLESKAFGVELLEFLLEGGVHEVDAGEIVDCGEGKEVGSFWRVIERGF